MSEEEATAHLICYIRKKQCIETPEELVRQKTVKTLCEKKGFPASLCGLELSLSTVLKEMSEISSSKKPLSSALFRRRIDLLFFRLSPLSLTPKPFFLIECKATFSRAEQLAQRQVMGYRYALGQVPFIAIVSDCEMVIWTKKTLGTLPWYRGDIHNCPSWDELGQRSII